MKTYQKGSAQLYIILLLMAFLAGSFYIATKPKKQEVQPPVTSNEKSSQITLTGKYTQAEENTMLGGMLCFEADASSSSKIPRSQDDLRKPWFCFSDQDSAKKMLKTEDVVLKGQGGCVLTGNAHVVVSNYMVDRKIGGIDTSRFDTAKLEKVIAYSKPVLQNCTTE